MRIAKNLFTLFYVLYALLFSFIFLWGIGSGEQSFLAVLALGISSTLVLFVLSGKISDLSERDIERLPRFLKAACVVLIFIQILFAVAFQTSNDWGWDFDTIIHLAQSFVNGSTEVSYAYLAAYQNNLLYFWMVVLIFALTKFISGNCQVFLVLVFNILILDISLFGVYKTVELLKGKKQAYFVVVCCLFFTPFWFYIPIAYTDIFSMPFFVFPILFVLLYEKKTPNSLFLLESGILGAVGYHFKGTPAIVIVAVFLYMILRGRAVGYGIKAIAVFTGGVIFTFLLTGWILTLSLGILVPKDADNYKYPIGYWIYTGLLGNGSWNSEIYTQTGNFMSYEEKQTYLNEAIAEQIREYGVTGLTVHVFSKEAKGLWNKGTLNAEVYVQRMPVHSGFVPRMIAENSFLGMLYRCYSQGYWRFLLIFFTAGIWRRISPQNREDAWDLLFLTAFGVLLFYSFWEINARYLINNVWIILIVAADSLYVLGEHLKEDGRIQ